MKLYAERCLPQRSIIIKGGYYDHFWIHRSKWRFWYQMKSPYFSHYACEILRAADVACKSYKGKRSESSITTIITIRGSYNKFVELPRVRRLIDSID